MKYLDLLKNIKEPIFSLQDLKIAGLKAYPYQLSVWTDEGLLVKLKNGLYAFSEKRNELQNEQIAFNLYQPSYVSMEWALSKYGLIPEMVYSCSSVTSKTTRIFKNDFGVFSFKHIKKELFFGYKKINNEGRVYLMAEPEKALFDFMYFNSAKIKTSGDIEEYRFNELELKKLNQRKLKKYFLLLKNKKIADMYNLLINYYK